MARWCVTASSRLTGKTVCSTLRKPACEGENENERQFLAAAHERLCTHARTHARSPTHPYLSSKLSGCPDPEHQTQSAGQQIPISAMQMRRRSTNTLLFQRVFGPLAAKKHTQRRPRQRSEHCCVLPRRQKITGMDEGDKEPRKRSRF